MPGIPQLVAERKDGKRPGYRGEAAAASDKAGGRSAGRDTSSAGTSNVGGDFNRDSFQAAQRMGEARQIAKNIAEDKAEEEVERFRNKQFQGSNLPGLFGLATNIFKGPFQKGMTVNRNFFLDKVLPSKNFKDINFTSLTPSQQNALYGDYMSQRLSGNIDAYGNSIVSTGADDNPLQNMLLAQQQAAIANPLGNVTTGVPQGGVGALYAQYMRNLGYML